MHRIFQFLLILSVSLALAFGGSGCGNGSPAASAGPSSPAALSRQEKNPARTEDVLDNIPPFSGKPYVVLNQNQPDFPPEDMNEQSFERYSPLDALGRCGPAYANLSLELMPTEKRGMIGAVHPTGWHLVKYAGIPGHYLYNRCHLLAYELTAENANPRNLITGTRYLNITGMLPFENRIAEYIRNTGHHVLYRVTPVFRGDELLARGVHMEAQSVEDRGEGLRFNVFCYNVQPGITLDYATGDSAAGEEASGPAQEAPAAAQDYILNTRTRKFHYPWCSGAARTSIGSRREVHASRTDLVSQGYKPCHICNP